MGRHAEAQELARRIERAEPVAPYDDFNRRVAAFKGGDYRAAKTLFEREVQRAPYDDEFHFWLAQTLLRLGDAPAARDPLALAVDTSTRSDDRRRYAAKLTHLEQVTAGGMPP